MGKLTTEEVIKRFKEVHGETYIYSKYEHKGFYEKSIIICKIHGEFEQSYGKHYCSKQRCPKCSLNKRSEKRKLTKEQVIKDFEKVHGKRYDYSEGEYINAKTPFKIKCREHGFFYQTPDLHKHNTGCPKCGIIKYSNKCKSNKEKFIERANKVHNFFYNYDRFIYEGWNKKSFITCPIHGDFLQDSNHHMGGCGCPSCKRSHGEVEISNYLDSLNIKYEREKRFKGCKNKRCLPFDFYLPNYNICIEYDGFQHYRPSTFGGISKEEAKKIFNITKLRDEIKNKYCKDNNINLIRIRYKENIEEKLNFLT